MVAIEAGEPLFYSNAEIMDVPDLPRGAFDMDNILDPLGDPLIGQNHGTEIMELQEVRFTFKTQRLLH